MLKTFTEAPFAYPLMTHHPKTCFGLLRHTATEWNQSRRIQGHADSPLTLTGEALALQWGQLLAGSSWSRILSSDLGRALKTASLINRSLNLPLSFDSRLREKDWGEWTGKTYAQLKKEHPDIWAEHMPSGWDFCPPGGESFRCVWKRGLEALAAVAGRYPRERILVVTHEGLIKSLIYHESTLSDFFRNGQCLMPYHLHCLTFSNGSLRLAHLNYMDLSSPALASSVQP